MINNAQGLGDFKTENIVAVLRALWEADMYAGMLPLRLAALGHLGNSTSDVVKGGPDDREWYIRPTLSATAVHGTQQARRELHGRRIFVGSRLFQGNLLEDANNEEVVQSAGTADR